MNPFARMGLWFSCSLVSNSLGLYGLLCSRLPCPSPSLRACSNSGPLSQCCHPTNSSSFIPFSSCLQSFPASRSFSMSWLFASKDWSFSFCISPSNEHSGLTGLISLVSKGLSRVFSSTTNRKHKFFSTQPSLPEKAMATHSSTLAWKIPWMEEPGRLQSMGSLSQT